MLVDVQRGGIESVYELAEKTNDLTEADLDHAEALYEAGRAGEARQFVLDRVAERNEQIANATQSAWTPAVNNLKSAWSSFRSEENTSELQSLMRISYAVFCLKNKKMRICNRFTTLQDKDK